MASKKSRYERLVATRGGRQWLAEHPEVGAAFALADLLRTWGEILTDELVTSKDRTRPKPLTEGDRRTLVARIWAVERAVGGYSNDQKSKRAALREALEIGVALLRRQRDHGREWMRGIRGAVRMALVNGITPAPAVTDELIDHAVLAWAKSRRDWKRILPLARAIGACGPGMTAPSLAKQMQREE